ncbi:acyl-ACP desaturase [Streptomyces sp. NPDC059679]|uniref:acyl-ACP desaturase n=1 Tax=Streptomyces sp. NPDC059679 TaxID=3346903 RepID=UPI0036936571
MDLLPEETLYRQYMEFFELAERRRRWSVFDDIPWDKWQEQSRDESLAQCAETFLGVEMYLPDYVAEGLNVVRESFGQAWFQVNWGYEESKHALALKEFLLRTGQRTDEQIREFEKRVLSRRWTMPFSTPRRMFVYGAIQEKTTWMSYRQQLNRARDLGDPVMAEICRYIARDEAAHADFYRRTLQACLQEDHEGTLKDIAHVVKEFKMPAYDLLPDYDKRLAVMQVIGIDREVFFRDVLMPTLKKVGVSRRDLVRARGQLRQEDGERRDGRDQGEDA